MSEEEFLKLFVDLDGKAPVLAMSSKSSPKRSKTGMRAPRGDEGVSKFVEVPGALLTKEDYPTIIAEELYQFLQEIFESNI